jgi:hypothetical protein
MQSYRGFLLPLLVTIAMFVTEVAAIEVRFVAERLLGNVGEVVLSDGDWRSNSFALPKNNLSHPQEVPGREFLLVDLSNQSTLASIQLPEKGESFIVLLVSASKSDYSQVVIPFEDPKFQGGDIFVYNNTEHSVFGKVGSVNFWVNPGDRSIITPKGVPEAGFYDVTLGTKEGTTIRVISTCRWPQDKRARSYIFFFLNPETKQISYRAVSEFLNPLTEQNAKAEQKNETS